MSGICEDSRLSQFPLKKRLKIHGISARIPPFPRLPTSTEPPAWNGTDEDRFNLFEPPRSEEEPPEKNQLVVVSKASTETERLQTRKTKRREVNVRKPSQKKRVY